MPEQRRRRTDFQQSISRPVAEQRESGVDSAQGQEREYSADEIEKALDRLLGDTFYVKFKGKYQNKLVFRAIKPLPDEATITSRLDGIAETLNAAKNDDAIIEQAVESTDGVALEDCGSDQ
jgi:hypothetical protein